MRTWIYFSLLLSITLGAAESFAPDLLVRDAAKRPWSGRPFLDREDQFQFVIVTDRTGGQRDGIFAEAVRKINLMRPEFVMSIGDLVEGYLDDETQYDREWTYFDGMVDDLAMKFFYLPGNHDIWSDFSRAAWEQRFGASYYHFLYKDVLFLALNSEDGQSTALGPEQVQYFLDVLEAHRDVRWTLVFTHKPFWFYEETGSRETGWAELETVLKDRAHTVFAGHRHQYLSFARNNTRYIQLATTGGSSDLSGPVHGRFDHFVWVTMTPEGPMIANILLDGVLDQDVRTEETAEVLGSLGRSFGVTIDPVRPDDGDLSGHLRTTMRIENRAPLPLSLGGRFILPEAVHLNRASLDFQVAPESTIAVPLIFSNPGDTGAMAGLVVPFEYSITFRPSEIGGPVMWERTAFAAVESVDVIPLRSVPILIDGSGDDWSSFAYVTERPLALSGAHKSWMGPGDLSYEFALRQDDENLFLGIQVLDDSFVDKGRAGSGSQDYLRVQIDARPRSRWSDQGSNETWSEAPLSFYASPSMHKDASRPTGPKGVSLLGAGQPTPEGYFYEMAVPHAVLDQCAGGEWQDIRLNVSVTDLDSHIGARTTVWWRPSWTSSGNYTDSGRFRRFE